MVLASPHYFVDILNLRPPVGSISTDALHLPGIEPATLGIHIKLSLQANQDEVRSKI